MNILHYINCTNHNLLTPLKVSIIWVTKKINQELTVLIIQSTFFIIHITYKKYYYLKLLTNLSQNKILMLLIGFIALFVYSDSFLQIIPHGKHPCLKLVVATTNPHRGLSPPSYLPCTAH